MVRSSIFSRHQLAAYFGLGLLIAATQGLASNPGDTPPKPKETDSDPFGDLFGEDDNESDEVNALDNLRRATQSIDKAKTGNTLVPKEAEKNTRASYHSAMAFAADRIYVHPKKGCQAAGRKKKKVGELRYERLPVEGPPLVVCLQLKSNVNRKVSVSLSITDPRRKKVSFARSTLNFTGQESVEHIMEYPPSVYRNPGQYEYVIDVEGKTIARVPLYKVIIDDNL